MSLLAGDQARVQLEGAMHAMEDRLHNSRQSSAFLLPSSHSAALHTADQGAPRRTIQHSATHARRAVVPIHLGRPARPSPPIPKRSPQALITPRRESPQQIKAAPRRAGPYEVGRGVAGHRSRGTRGLIRPDTAAILTSRSLWMSGRTWSLRRAEGRAFNLLRLRGLKRKKS